jgi:hypothetical protein
MNNKMLLMVVGVVNLVAGVLGFFTDPVFGLLAVNGAHNVIHLTTGVAALYAAMNEDYRALIAKIFGVVYTLVAVLGFVLVPTEGDLLGLVRVNTADHFYHVLLAVVFLYVGFMSNGKKATA